MSKQSSILLTGGCGYIGSQVARQLFDVGRPLVVIDDLSTGRREALPDAVPVVIGDVGDHDLVASLLRTYRVETVMHFAASAVVPASIAAPLPYYENNVANSLKLLRACVDAGVENFIFSSTAAVYGDHRGDAPVTEAIETQPTNPYGRSKLIVEWMLEDLSRVSRMRHVILRYFNVAGADMQGRGGQRMQNATHLIKVASQVAVGILPTLEIFGNDYPTADGTCVRDYIHVEDLATAHVSALRYLELGGASAVVNCGYGRGFSVQEVVSAIEEVVGRSLPRTWAARRPGDVSTLIADSSKARELLDWTPRYDDLKAIVRSALDWERTLRGDAH